MPSTVNEKIMYKNLIGLFLLGGLFLSSCTEEPTTGVTPSGMDYNIVKRSGDKVKLDSGMVAMVNLRQTLVGVEGDTLMSRNTDTPVPINMTGDADPMMEALRLMSKGDSASMSCASKKFFPQLPPSVPEDSKVCYEVGVVDVFTTEEDYMAYSEKLEEERVATEAATLEKYLADNGMSDAQKTENGLHYVVTEEGTGEMASAGDFIEVNYTGTLLDGTKFDSSIDRGETFVFQVGQGRVIRGWDEGFLLLKEGSKGTLVIPSHLAYGSRGAGGVIKPNSPLKFEIEFIKNHKDVNPKAEKTPQPQK